MIFLADIFFLFLKPKYISTKDKIAKVGPAGKVKIEDITGCHKNPEQFKISNDANRYGSRLEVFLNDFTTILSRQVSKKWKKFDQDII